MRAPLRALACSLLMIVAAAAARAAEPLTICLDEESPPWSMHGDRGHAGFDYAVGEAVAKRLHRPFAVQWFESKIEEDASTTLSVNALMSDGKCQLFGSYPLTRDALGKPGFEIWRLPDFEGAKRADRSRHVRLGELVPSKPFHRAVFAVILGKDAASKQINGIGDLVGLKLGAEGGTLTDAVLMLFGGGKLVDHVVHVAPGKSDLLPRLERGDFSATLTEIRSFDAYRAKHPDTSLKLTSYYYPVGFNMGFVGLATERALIEEVNAAIADMLAKNEFAALAEASGMTYVPPSGPDVLEKLTINDLRGN